MRIIDSGETLLLEVRKHWIVLLSEVIPLILIMLVSIALFLTAFIGADATLRPLLVFWSIAWMLLLWITFFILWTNYYLDVWVLTDLRVIDIDQRGLFSREVSEFRLDRIQDITVEVHGILQTALDFGNLYLQTAGEKREFIAKNIPHPYEVKDAIFQAHDKLVNRSQVSPLEMTRRRV